MFPFRVGQGYDVHQLVENRPFWLGGILIPHTHGAKGRGKTGAKIIFGKHEEAARSYSEKRIVPRKKKRRIHWMRLGNCARFLPF
mgnify:CR=1 FL=1